MTLEVIYVVRHGFRSNWLVDPSNGSYSSVVKSPTGNPADPALTAHGVEQARELGERLFAADPPIERVYSSLYYRCLQTVEPFVKKTALSPLSTAATPVRGNAATATSGGLRIRGETGIGEWFGAAKFEHPMPATPEVLASHFPALLDLSYTAAVVPTRMGEGVGELHDRVAATLDALVTDCDRDGIRAILLCTHAAVVIALGRALTGRMPESIEAEDFGAFTCGLSVYRRRESGSGDKDGEEGTTAVAGRSPTLVRATDAGNRCQVGRVEWRGRGVSGGWDCLLDSDCSHLSSGEERGWRFSGDEAFHDAAGQRSILDAGQLGVVVEGKGKGSSETAKVDSDGEAKKLGGTPRL